MGYIFNDPELMSRTGLTKHRHKRRLSILLEIDTKQPIEKYRRIPVGIDRNLDN